MSVSGQVSVAGPPHQGARAPKRRAPILNSADARPCGRSPRGPAPLCRTGVGSLRARPRSPAVPGRRTGTGRGTAAHGRPGLASLRGAGVMALLSISSSPVPRRSRNCSESGSERGVQRLAGRPAPTRARGHDRGTEGTETFSTPPVRTPERPFRRRRRRKRVVFGHRPPNVQETTSPNPEWASRVSIPAKKRECAQRGRSRPAPPPRTARSPDPRARPAPTRPPPDRLGAATG
jgi:hypothetical protein